MKTLFTFQVTASSVPSFNTYFEKKFSLRFLLFFLLLLTSFKGIAEDNTWTGGGGDANWSTATNWSLGVPTAVHRVVFNTSNNVIQTGAVTVSAIKITNNATVSINSTGVAHSFTCTNGINSIIDVGSTLNLTGNTAVISLVFTSGGTTEIFVINGTLNIGSNATFNSANSNTSVNGTIKRSSITASTVLSSALSLNFLTGGSFELVANAGIIPIATWNSNSNLKILGVINGTLSGMAQDFGNITWNCSGQIAPTTFSPNSVNGNFDVQNTNSQLLSVTTTPLTISGNYIQAGDVRIASLSVPRTWNVHGDVIINAGTLTLSTGTGIGTINVKGNFTHLGGTITETASGSGQINFDGITTYTSGGTVSNTVDFTVNASKILTMATTGTVITGGGSFTLNSGSTLNIKSADGITTSGANGNILVTGARAYDSKANYIYSGANQTTGNGLTAADSLKFQGSGTKAFSNAITISGNTTIANGVVVGLGSFASSTGTLTIKSEGTPKGTWGSTASNATYKNATYFGTSDLGALNIVTGSCPPIIVSPVSATPTAVMCFGGSNGSISLPTAETSGGTLEKSLSYSWLKNGGGFSSTLQSPSSLLAGTYSVTITATNANQCTGNLVVSGIVVTQPAIITASIFSQTNVFCKGNSTGSVTITGSGGMGSYMYQLGNGIYQPSNTFSTLLAGTYIVTVKDDNNCTTPISVTITEPTSITSVTASNNSPVCSDSTVDLISAISNSTAISTIVWTGPNSYTASTANASITNLETAKSGIYTIAVTDANNCVVTATTNVVINPPPAVYVVSGGGFYCEGSLSGSQVTLSGSAVGFNYTLNSVSFPYAGSTLAGTGNQLNFATPPAAGIYTITSKSTTTNCSIIMTGNAINTFASPPSITAIETNVNCKGGSDGTITITGSGGSGSYKYVINGDSYVLNPVFSVSAGTYNMKVKDVATGCESVGFLITVAEPASLPSGTISGTTFVCVDSSAPIITFSGSGGSGALTYTYRINKGDDLRTTSNIITPTGMAGSFTYGLLRVTDTNNCVVNYTTQDTATVTVNPLPIFTTTFTNPTCSGFTDGSIKIITSVISPKFNINGETYIAGTSPHTFSTLADATYTIKIKDGNSCESPAQTVILRQPAIIVVNAIPTSAVCFGGNGSAILSATGGNGSYTFSSSGGIVTGNSLSAIAETYLITATDGNGCSGTFSVTIGQPTTATSISASSNSAICETSVLNLSSTPISSTNGLTYAWAGPNAFTASTQNASIETTTLLAAGTYTVTITDANGCVATAITSVMINPSPSAFLVTGTGAICNGVSSPITLSSSETEVNYNLKVVSLAYNGSVISGTGSTLSFIPPASPTGIYTIEATNMVTSCKRVMSGSVETSISTNPLLSVTSQTNVSCLGGSDATVTIVASLGSNSYNYTFNGETSQGTGVFTGKSAGTFPISAIDVNTGCVGTTNVTITEPTSLPNVTVTSSGIACLGNTVTLTATAIDGTAGYTYNWNETGFVASNSLPVTTSGVNIVTIKDSKGCISAATVSTTVTFNPLPVPIITGTKTICNGSTLNLMANDGITYAWSGPNSFTSTTAIISILNVHDSVAGVYSVIVTNANGCSATATSIVIVNAMPIRPIVQANVSIQSGLSISLTATGCVGTLIWFNAADNSSVPMPVSPTTTTNYYAKCEVTTNDVTCIGSASENVIVSVEQLVIFSIKSGDWEDLTTWNIGRLPLISEEVTIDGTHTITIRTDTQATAKKIIYKSNATLNFSNTSAKLTLRSL